MLTRDDIIDIILERLSREPRASAAGRPGGSARARPPADRCGLGEEIRGRRFLSEYDIKKQLTVNSQELRIPRDAILSPLAVDWLALGRVKIIRE
ncbi:MAG: hypothetical protein PHU21_08735 [Elusimicrobia bacterium]|nr:hypothetical protein [Elusimicrobiota bacterium]